MGEGGPEPGPDHGGGRNGSRGRDHEGEGGPEPGGGGAEPRSGRGTGRCVRMRRRLMAQGERYVREKVGYMIIGF